MMQIAELKTHITTLRAQKPLVLNLTNMVTMDFMANALLALGATPIMSCYDVELEELITISGAVNINIGTLDETFISRANTAARLCQHHTKPMILDPVGAGATKARTALSQALSPYATTIRGNASEILALTDKAAHTCGVDAADPVDHAAEVAPVLAAQHQAVIAISGPADVVCDDTQQMTLSYGTPLMTQVTGMGCTLTAVAAAFHAILPPYTATIAALQYFGLCGSQAATVSITAGSFRTAFIDALSAPDWEFFNANARS